jgi:hypothetical protein
VADELYGATKDPNHPTRAYIAPQVRARNDNTGVPGQFYRFRLKLPDNVSGDLVLLQWYYLTANSCTHPGYDKYSFPQDWGDMNDRLSLCGNIPADGNGTPGTCSRDTFFYHCVLFTCAHLTQVYSGTCCILSIMDRTILELRRGIHFDWSCCANLPGSSASSFGTCPHSYLSTCPHNNGWSNIGSNNAKVNSEPNIVWSNTCTNNAKLRWHLR